MAKYKKKRARELQHDRFRDTTITFFDRLGDRLAGKGKTILYGLVGLVVVAVLVGVWVRWSGRKADEARRALGRAITTSNTKLAGSPNLLDPTEPTFATEQERAQKSIDEFQKVAAKYGDPYHTQARYFIATNLLSIDREKGISELVEISKSSIPEVATLAKFALAQAKEADAKYDEAAQLYSAIASQNSSVVTPDNANIRLAAVYEKQGKKKEAVDILFNIVEASRKQKESDGTASPVSAAAREAEQQLQRLDPERHAKLTAPSPLTDLQF